MTNMIILAIHLAALGQIESGDRDDVIGHDGEVSRYQIMPAVWREQTTLPLGTARHPVVAGQVALKIWRHRMEVFQLAYGRRPSLPELYLIWHRPARPLAPRPEEAKRAERFANLVHSMDVPLPPSAGRPAKRVDSGKAKPKRFDTNFTN